MSELEKIFLTSGLTIFGGVVVFVIGQLVNRIFIGPYFEYQKVISDIDRDLIYFANIYNNPGQHNSNNPNAEKAQENLRKISCDLRRAYRNIPYKNIFIKNNLLIQESDKETVARELVGLSSALWRAEDIDHNLKRHDKIREIIR